MYHPIEECTCTFFYNICHRHTIPKKTVIFESVPLLCNFKFSKWQSDLSGWTCKLSNNWRSLTIFFISQSIMIPSKFHIPALIISALLIGACYFMHYSFLRRVSPSQSSYQKIILFLHPSSNWISSLSSSNNLSYILPQTTATRELSRISRP